jgi:hypothetical protein
VCVRVLSSFVVWCWFSLGVRLLLVEVHLVQTKVPDSMCQCCAVCFSGVLPALWVLACGVRTQ